MIRRIPVAEVGAIVQAMIGESVCNLPSEYLAALEKAAVEERSEVGRSCLKMLLDNAKLCESSGIPTCQDTGMVIIQLGVGQDVHFVGGDISQAIDNAVCVAYRGLRKSVVNDPLLRKNSGNNLPAIVYFQIVPGKEVRISLLLKGFGAELMSALQMFPPSIGVDGIKRFVLDTVIRAGPNACPPVIVGVGLGSSFEGVALLAKKALLRPVGCCNPFPHLQELEQELLESINELGIGPQGLGGRFTALAVHIESFPTHIAALPVAVNLNCSAPRVAVRVL